MRKFVIRFGLFSVVSFALLVNPPVRFWVQAFTRSLAGMTAATIHLAGGQATLAGDTLIAPGNGFSMKIMPGCDGVNVVMLLWSALLAWPAGLSVKLKGILFGALAIEAANMIRLIALYYLGQWNATWFEWVHVYVGEIAIMILGLAFFALWIRRISALANPDPAT